MKRLQLCKIITLAILLTGCYYKPTGAISFTKELHVKTDSLDIQFFPVIIDSVIYNQLSGINIIPGKVYSIPVDKAGKIFIKQ